MAVETTTRLDRYVKGVLPVANGGTGNTTGPALLTTANVTSNSPGALATDDFVFGSSQLNDDGNGDHDRRMFFDKSRYAFRAGFSSTDFWDEGNLGFGSVAFGLNTKASGSSSFASGNAAIAAGTYSFAHGNSAVQTGGYGLSIGSSVHATGINGNAFGSNYLNDQKYSLTVGYGTNFASAAGVAVRLEADTDQDGTKKKAIFINDTVAPTSTANRLYSVGGNLFWNGVQLN